MPGPRSNPGYLRPILKNNELVGEEFVAAGKTKIDKQSGKWYRRQVNRHADPIREKGGKQFGSKK